MKKMYRKKEEGVSPVIATILMVAITVVLAATVWLLVSGYMGGGTETPLAASLNYAAGESTATSAVFTISMSTPSQANPDSISVTLKNSTGTYTLAAGSITQSGTSVSVGSSDYTVTWLDLNGNGKVDTGDQLIIGNTNGVGGTVVYLYVSGYSGNAQGTVPS